MKKTLLILSLLLPALAVLAETQVTKSYRQRPLSEVLIDIDNAVPELSISFIYNKLEDYTVTCNITNAAPIDAIRQVIGFYPVRLSRQGNTVILEPVYDTERKLIGRVVDENGRALEFANVALYSVPDSTFITGGVTNKNGDFVIPCGKKNVHVNFSYIGFETKEMKVEFPGGAKSLNVGDVTLNEDKKIIREVLVEQTLASTSAEKSEYLPSKKQKNAATDATSLLQHMQIPQLRLNPLTGYVTTLSGESVAIFIDYMPASQEDLAGLNTQDVKRVDIYDYPKDVRFKGQPHVINFVMQKYEVGGYTKLSTKESALADFSANNLVYSKLSHKNWTFDANITSKVSNQNHLGSETVETFKLPTQTVSRTETFSDGKQRNRETSFSLRSTYQNEKMQLANRIEILDDNTPKNEMFGSVSYQPNLFSSSSSISRQDSRYITPTYEGDWNFFLPKQWMLQITPKFQYSHNKLNRFYQEGASSAIANDIKEDTHQTDWWIYLGKQLGKHSINFGNYGLKYGSRMDYTGSTATHQSMDFLAIGIPVKYYYQNNKLNFSALVTALYQHYKVNDMVKSDWSPAIITSANYAFNQKNKLQATLRYTLAAANGSLRNPSVIQENEILFYNGNPQLDNYNFFLGNLQYTWMPSNLFTATAFVEYIFDKNYYANVWKPYLDDGKILQTIENVGDMHTTEFGASLTLRLLDGNLQFNANPSLSIIKTTGEYDEKGSPFSLDVNASYYIGNFYLDAGYWSPNKSYKSRSVLWRRSRSYYYLSAGWGNANWKARLDVINPFRTDWRDTRTIVSSLMFSQTTTDFNSSSHQRLTLSISYIFNYGKKVKTGNELGTASGGQSSIL